MTRLMSRKLDSLWALFTIPFLVSCNVYSPLASPATDAEYREEARFCLEKQDYACALANYSKMTASESRDQKLCVINMARAGFTINVLLNIANDRTSGSQILAKIAQQVMPWNSVKAAAATEAVTQCAAYMSSATNQKFGTLLRALSLILDCSVRMSKSDLFVSANDTPDTCDLAGNANGVLTATDITADGTGILTSLNKGMCKTDVSACLTNMANVAALQLTNSGLSALSDNVTAAFNLINEATPVLQRQKLSQSVP